MRQEKIYKFKELSEDAKQKAIENWKQSNDEIFWQAEIFESLKAVFKKSGIKLKDYSLGLCTHSYLKFDMDDHIAELSGVRALGWIENNLLNDLRISRSQYLKNRKAYFSYGSAYRIGKIKPCPLTGVCFDEDFLSDLIDSVKSGMNLKDSYKALADCYVKLLQNEYDYQNSDEYISDHLIANEYEFFDSGERF